MYGELFGKAAAPLIQMIEELRDKKQLPYNFFFDNLFTGTKLFCTLKANGYSATGTVRNNRIPQNYPLQSKEEMAKQERGTFCSTLERNCCILYARWIENSIVTMASTCFGVAPVRNVERFSRKEKKNVAVSRPNVVLYLKAIQISILQTNFTNCDHLFPVLTIILENLEN